VYQHVRDIVARNLHLHGADFDFEVVVIAIRATLLAATADRLQLDRVAFGNMLHQLRLA
jgi:hypothetical protein